MRFLLLILSLFIFSHPAFANEEKKPKVLVSVAPHKFFIEKIAGTSVDVQLMVPAGASAHTYEPTPKQILSSSQAEIWFTLGESFEKKALSALTAYNKNLEIIDLRQNVDMIKADPLKGTCTCCHSAGYDLHIWLSAKQASIQAETIAKALGAKYPENKENYQNALKRFKDELELLDQEIEMELKGVKNRILMVSHPAYAYFCRDYNFTQLPIEFEGRDPTPYQLTLLLKKAKEAKISQIYIQPQYSSKGARLVAQELNAHVVTLNPYDEDFFASMRQIAKEFKNN